MENKEVKHPFINPNNEIKISEFTDVRETIDFVIELFTIKNYQTIILSGLNKAINKVVLIVEVVKTKIPGLYQLNEMNCLDGNSKKIKGDDKIVPRFSIKLTLSEPTEEEKNNIGYQNPLNILEANLINNIKNDIDQEF